MLCNEVVILGAGPAGAIAALNLAATRRVLCVDRRSAPIQRIGESLPPAARRLLADMGLWDDFLRQGHAVCHGNRSSWNGVDAQHDFLRDPDGQGWHLDRARFESWLRRQAIDRGAALEVATTVSAVQAIEEGWQLSLDTPAGPREVQTRLLIDASGRAATLARKLGARRRRHDKLVCVWLYGRDQHALRDTRSFVAAAEHGWWYTAALPEQRRVLAFHTDSDLPVARTLRMSGSLLEAAMATPDLAAQLTSARFAADAETALAPAHSSTLDPGAADRWCAVGDAAISFDPLSSQGLFNALYTGLAAAEACDRRLGGDGFALDDYAGALSRIGASYFKRLDFWYGQESRWPESAFWQRRQNANANSAVARGD